MVRETWEGVDYGSGGVLDMRPDLIANAVFEDGWMGG